MELAILHKLDLYAEVRKIRSDTRGLSFTNHWCSLTDIFAARPDLKSNLLQPTQKQRNCSNANSPTPGVAARFGKLAVGTQTSACQPGVSYSPGCTRIFQVRTIVMDGRGV